METRPILDYAEPDLDVTEDPDRFVEADPGLPAPGHGREASKDSGGQQGEDGPRRYVHPLSGVPWRSR